MVYRWSDRGVWRGKPIAITVAIDDVDSSVTSSAAGTFAKDILKYMLTEGGSEDE